MMIPGINQARNFFSFLIFPVFVFPVPGAAGQVFGFLFSCQTLLNIVFLQVYNINVENLCFSRKKEYGNYSGRICFI